MAAWGDEEHVAATREHYRLKREVVLPALVHAGLRPAGGPATFFLWMAVDGRGDEAFATALLERHGIVVAPGSYLGAPGYVRVALVPTLEECRRAAELLTGARAGSR